MQNSKNLDSYYQILKTNAIKTSHNEYEKYQEKLNQDCSKNVPYLSQSQTPVNFDNLPIQSKFGNRSDQRTEQISLKAKGAVEEINLGQNNLKENIPSFINSGHPQINNLPNSSCRPNQSSVSYKATSSISNSKITKSQNSSRGNKKKEQKEGAAKFVTNQNDYSTYGDDSDWFNCVRLSQMNINSQKSQIEDKVLSEVKEVQSFLSSQKSLEDSIYTQVIYQQFEADVRLTKKVFFDSLNLVFRCKVERNEIILHMTQQQLSSRKYLEGRNYRMMIKQIPIQDNNGKLCHYLCC